MKRTLFAAGALTLALLTAPAFAADDANRQGLYLGAGIGDFSTNIPDISDVDNADINFDSDEDALRVFAGWRFNRFLAAQLDYTDFGSSSAATNTLNVSADTKGIAPAVIGTLPLGPVELFAKAGILFYDVNVNENANTVSNLVDASGHDPVFGAGIGVEIANHLSVRAEYERIDINEFNDSNSVWLTASWRF